MRSILFILLLPAIAYGALYGYLWYEVKSQTEEVAASAAPFAKLSYGNIHISPLGDELGLNNIIISPVMTSDTFRIEKLRIKAPHFGQLLKLSGVLGENALPENVSLHLKGIHIDLESQIFTVVEQMQAQAASAEPASPSTMMFSPDALGCGGRSRFSVGDYSAMGMGNLVSDISAESWYNPQLHRTNIKIDADFRGLYSVGLNFELDGSLKQMNRQDTTLPRTYISYRDAGYYKLRNKFCAIENNTSIDSYVERNIELLKAVLGATIPRDDLAAYRKFMHNGGSLAIRLAPYSNFPLDGLSYYKPADIIDMLGLSIRIDNTPIALDKFKWGEQRLALTQIRTEIRDSEPADNEPTTIPPRELLESRRASGSSSSPSFHVIRLEHAAKYLNHLAEVTTSDGRVRQGIIKQTDQVQLLLVMKVTSGTLTYPVNLAEIERLRVRY